MATEGYALVLIGLTSWLVCHAPSTEGSSLIPPTGAQPAVERSSVESLVTIPTAALRPEPLVAEKLWRRTAQGWQRADWLMEDMVDAGPPPVMRVDVPPVHPALFSVALLLLSLGVLIAFPCSHPRRPRATSPDA